MKTIPITKGRETIVDDEDYDYLNQWKWHAKEEYVQRSFDRMLMHRLLVGAKKGDIVDHINRNPLDNRRKNLRIVTQQQNCFNRSIQCNSTSGFQGVTLRKDRKNFKRPWRAAIKKDGERIEIGYFETKEKAGEAYQLAKSILHKIA